MNYFNSKGVQTYTNIMAAQDGQLVHAVNVVSFPYGAKSNRPGYSAYLGTPDNATVNSLFAFPNISNSGTQINLYRASGSSLYYSLQGTGISITVKIQVLQERHLLQYHKNHTSMISLPL